jgi:hypothetical protein
MTELPCTGGRGQPSEDDIGTDPVVPRSGKLELRVTVGGREMVHPLPNAANVTIGRSPSAGLRLDHRSVSRQHAVLTVVDGKLKISDLGSQNGTRVNGAALEPRIPTELAVGVVFEIGVASLVVSEVPADPTVADSPLKAELRSHEREQIRAALEHCGGNQTRAAQLLGISRRTLVSRLSEHGLPRPKKG